MTFEGEIEGGGEREKERREGRSEGGVRERERGGRERRQRNRRDGKKEMK